MPTFRENSFISNPIDFDRLDEFCKDNNYIFILKMHPFTRFEGIDSIKKGDYEYIRWYEVSCDIHPFLKYSDMLISDYSGIYFDYLLLDKPIVLFHYDKQEYISYRGLIEEFDELLVADIAYGFEELLISIKTQLFHDDYKAIRGEIKDKIHKYQDFQSSKRVLELIKTKVSK